MRALRQPFSRLNAVDWAHLHAKGAGAAWAVTLFLLTPSVVAASLGTVLVWVMTSFTLVGAVLSAVGLFLAARIRENEPSALRADLRRSLAGLGLELIGIVLMLIGVLLYLATQGFLSVTLTNGTERIALVVFAYFQCSQLTARLASVLYRRHKETKLARNLGGTT